jgi:hypothetical protein
MEDPASFHEQILSRAKAPHKKASRMYVPFHARGFINATCLNKGIDYGLINGT